VGRRSTRYARAHALAIAEQTASAKPYINPDATIGPEASLEFTSEKWMGSDSTSIPDIGEEDKEELSGPRKSDKI